MGTLFSVTKHEPYETEIVLYKVLQSPTTVFPQNSHLGDPD